MMRIQPSKLLPGGQLVIEAIATGVKELRDEHSRKLISKQTETKLIRLIEDLSDAFEKSI